MSPSDPRRFARNKASSTPPRAMPSRAPKAPAPRPATKGGRPGAVPAPSQKRAPARPVAAEPGARKPAASKPAASKPAAPRPAASTRAKAAPKRDATRPVKRPTKAARTALKVAAKALEPKAPVMIPLAPAKPPRVRKTKPASAPVVVVPPVVVPPAPPVAKAPAPAPAPTTGAPAPLSSEELLLRIAALVRERRGEDLVALDVRGLADYMDFMLVATGRSDRQNRAIADGLMRGLRGLKVRPLKRPEPEDGAWICLDFVDVVVHIFDGITRAHYDLENLWGDAPRFPLPEAAPPTVG